MAIAVLAAIVPATARDDRSARPPGDVVRMALAPDTASALRQARHQGSRVEALDLRTETRAVFAEPNGTMTAEMNTRPVRAQRGDGSWEPVNLTLVRRPDGTVGPANATVDLAFSGGGGGRALVRYGKGGAWMELAWPGRLPAPELAADTATYADVLPGVDLLLRAETGGYSQYLVVKDRKAAANPALRAVRLSLRTKGLTVRSTRDGALEARDAKGAVLFSAPVSRMWDSGSPRREALVDVAVERGALVLRPDRELLTDPATRYPVTVDPIWRTADKQHWASVLSGKAGTHYYDSSGAPPLAQVGQCYDANNECNGIGVARTYWLFDTSFLSGRIIISASLRLTVVYSPNCDATSHQLYLAAAALEYNRSTWTDQPGGTGDPIGFSAPAACAGYEEVGFGVTGKVNAGGSTTFLVKAADERTSAQLAWRKYDNNAKLSVNFNRLPDRPTGLSSDPPLVACRWCGGTPYVADENIRLMATLTDPDSDQLQSLWQTKVDGVATHTRSTFVNSGQIHSHTFNTDGKDGKAVEWAVKGEDGAHGGDWALGTTFAVDRTRPGSRPNVGGVPYVEDNSWHGGVGVPGRFTFGPAGVNDIDHYLWGWGNDPVNKVVAASLGGAATVELTPPGDGPRDLTVVSVDRAGNQSDPTRYHFYVRGGSGPLAQWALDGNATDDAFLGERDGVVIGGVSYGPGAVGQAARFDGSTGYITPPYTVRTDGSFAVSAWARVDTPGGLRAVVSQAGGKFPGFGLWYRPENGGRWAFGMARSDTTDQGADQALSTQSAQVGVWTHLTGVYSAGERKLRLYVNGVPVATANRTVADWPATGRVEIGRVVWNGTATQYWSGMVDEVRIYDRTLSDAEVAAAVGTDDVRVAHWRFDEKTGRTGRNDVDGGEMVSLFGDAAFSGDSDGDGLADGGAVGGAVLLDGTGDYAATAGPAVHTDQSFTVAGWVELNEAPSAGNLLTVLSQDGTAISGFFLGYRAKASGGVWEFALPGTDVKLSPTGAGIQSNVVAQLNKPTHLAAMYDAGTKKIRLYVNGKLAGFGDRLDGFDATGGLVVGRGLNGEPGGYWKGWADEVRAYSRALSEAEVEAIVTRDDVALGEWRLDGNTAPTRPEAGTGTAVGTATWTGGQSDAPDPTDLALRLSGDDHVTLPHTVDVRGSFAVSAWVKLDKVGTTTTVLSQDGTNSSAFQLMAMPDGRWAFGMIGSDATVTTQDRVDGPLAQVGVWTHLVASYDAAARQIALYVNGVAAGTAKHHQQTWQHDAGALVIGAGQWNTNRLNALVGAVDDVTVYGRTLFAAEIRQMAGRDLTLAHNWRLDESSGDQAPDAVGRRAATAAGGLSRVPGRIGNAVKFNGTDGRLATGGIDMRTDDNFTVAAWVNLEHTCDLPDGVAECKQVAVSLDGPSGGPSKFRLGHWRDRDQHVEGVWVFEMPEANGTITKAAVPVLPSDLTRWVHLAGVYDKVSGKLWLYVNGTRKGDGQLQQAWSTGGGIQIGRARDASGNPGQYLPGMVDDVRLYNGALDDNRIANLYNSYPVQCGTIGRPTACTLPAASGGRWQFDENTGTTAADASGKGQTATLSGGADWTGGRVGHAGRFDGTSGYARTAGPVVTPSTGFSIAAWVYGGTATPASKQVILAQGAASGSAFTLYRDPSNRWGASALSGSPTPNQVAILSSELVWPGQWTHLGLVYNPTLGQLRLYVNGRLSAAQTEVAMVDAPGSLTMARDAAGGAFFAGGIDDVRAFPVALRDGEMVEVYDDTAPIGMGAWTFDDQTVRDSSWRNNPTTTTGPVSYLDGVKGKALKVGGSTAATTGQVGVLPLFSFTVSAWVRLTYEPAVQTVVGQDGTRRSGYALQYRPELDTWVFGAGVQDDDAAELTFARAGAPAVLGEWTHLTGVYDHAASQLKIYVNGKLSGIRDGVTLWAATGGLTIGRGQAFGAPAQFLTGEIDEVRVDLGIVPDSDIAQRAVRA